LGRPIIYMLLWSEYNYRYVLELSKVPLRLISEKTISLYSQENLIFYELLRCIVVFILQRQCNDGNGELS